MRTQQDQFLDVIDRDEAERRFRGALDWAPRGRETVPLADALGRVLAEDVTSPVNVPAFDRSNFDGFAVRAADTVGGQEESPRSLDLAAEEIATGRVPRGELQPGTAMVIATGGMLPRGADAIVMMEHADVAGGRVEVRRSVAAGFGVTFAATDIAAGEAVLRRGTVLTSRETGVVAAIGRSHLSVWRRPRVAILSTGDEIVEPGGPLPLGSIYDSNARILADAVRELGGQDVPLGIVGDDAAALRAKIKEGLEACDLVLLSGGTSKGAGDQSYRVLRELRDPGIVAHGVALKPGKPICLAVTGGRPVVVLPGFPTSAVFTFHEFVAPVILAWGGRSRPPRGRVRGRLATRVNSEPGRTEYLLVGLVERVAAPEDSVRFAAFPLGKGSGSVTTFCHADGFITLGRHEELVEAGTDLEVQLLGRDLEVADLVVIGSQCLGLDYLLGCLQDEGYRTKFLAVGSTAGLDAVRRNECDLAGIHLWDAATETYNEPFLSADELLLRGYGRLQGVIFRQGDNRFEGLRAEDAVAGARHDPDCRLINRNPGSGTRILIDRLLAGSQPPGYAVQARSHPAVAAAIAQGRADWSVAIRSAAERAGLGFLPLVAEQFDFVVPRQRAGRPAVVAFRNLLQQAATRRQLQELGLG